eukprot:g3349.t1
MAKRSRTKVSNTTPKIDSKKKKKKQKSLSISGTKNGKKKELGNDQLAMNADHARATNSLAVHRTRFTGWMPSGIVSMARSPAPLPRSAKEEKDNTEFSSPIVAVARENGDVELWNACNSFYRERVIKGRPGITIRSLEWIRDDQNDARLFGVTLEGDLFEVDCYRLSFRRVTHTVAAVWAMKCRPRGNRGRTKTQTPLLLALGCDDGKVRLYDAPLRSCTKDTSDLENNGLGQATFHLNTTLFAGVNLNTRATSRAMYDSEHSDESNIAKVLALTWHPEGNVLFAACGDGYIYSWYDEGKIKPNNDYAEWLPYLRPIRVENYGVEKTLVWSLACFADYTLVTGDSIGHVQFWNVKDGRGLFMQDSEDDDFLEDSRTSMRRSRKTNKPQHASLLQSFAQHTGDILALEIIDTTKNLNAKTNHTTKYNAPTVMGAQLPPTVFASGVDSKVVMLQRLDGSSSNSRRQHAKNRVSTLSSSASSSTSGRTHAWIYSHACRPHSHDIRSLLAFTIPLRPREESHYGKQSHHGKQHQSRFALKLLSGGVDTQMFLHDVKSFRKTRPCRIAPFPHHAPVQLVNRSLMINHDKYIDVWKLCRWNSQPQETNRRELRQGTRKEPQHAFRIQLLENEANIETACFTLDEKYLFCSAGGRLRIFSIQQTNLSKNLSTPTTVSKKTDMKVKQCKNYLVDSQVPYIAHPSIIHQVRRIQTVGTNARRLIMVCRNGQVLVVHLHEEPRNNVKLVIVGCFNEYVRENTIGKLSRDDDESDSDSEDENEAASEGEGMESDNELNRNRYKGGLRFLLSSPKAAIQLLAVSHDGQYLATCDTENNAFIYSLDTLSLHGRIPTRVSSKYGSVTAIRFQNDGTNALSSNPSRSVVLAKMYQSKPYLEVYSLSSLLLLRKHTNTVTWNERSTYLSPIVSQILSRPQQQQAPTTNKTGAVALSHELLLCSQRSLAKVIDEEIEDSGTTCVTKWDKLTRYRPLLFAEFLQKEQMSPDHSKEQQRMKKTSKKQKQRKRERTPVHSQQELVVVEIPWLSILQNMPSVLSRKRYGRG